MKMAASVSPTGAVSFWKSKYGRAANSIKPEFDRWSYREWRNPRNWWLPNADGALLVRRKHDGLWMFPGGRKRARESDKDCLRREINEELPKLELGRLTLWKEVKAKNRRSGRKMSDAIFVTAKASGRLTIGDIHEIDKATWREPRGIRLTPTSRYIRDKLFPRSN